MGKASKRKQRDVEPGPGAPSFTDPPGWAVPLLLGSVVAGVVLAAISTWIHYQVTAHGGAYTSFCNVSETVNCDSVVTSAHGKLFGVQVSVWAILFYVGLGAFVLRASRGAAGAREQARADTLGLAIAGAGFSLYMAMISLTVLRTVCLLCAGLYLVSLASLFAAWRFGSPLAASLARLYERWNGLRRRPALAAAGAGAIALVLLVPGWLGAPTRLTRQEVFRKNPQFYDWYTSQPVVEPPAGGGHAQGSKDVPIELIEFSDFECPHCGQAHVMLKDLLSRYRDDVRFVFHHFPLSNECNDTMPGRGHENACEAAIAAECAADGGKFAPFANLLFARQGALGSDALKAYAKEVGLDSREFERCLAKPDAAGRVRADVEAGKRAGVRSTPTFFINGRRIEGNMTYESWILAFAVELDKG